MGVGWFWGLIFLFYMLFPFFVFLMDNRRRAWKTFIIVHILCFISISYFYSNKFLCYEAIPKNIMYNLPFFILGGVVYLYRDIIEKKVQKYRLLVLIVCIVVTVSYWNWADTQNSYMGVIIISIVMGGADICYR